jgi:hypothetical protein
MDTVAAFNCRIDFSTFIGIRNLAALPKECWWHTGERRYLLSLDGGTRSNLNGAGDGPGLRLPDGIDTIAGTKSTCSSNKGLFFHSLDQRLYTKFIEWSNLYARHTRCPVAEALFEDVWTHSYPKDALKSSRMHAINCAWDGATNSIDSAGFSNERECFRANNQYVTNATTYFAGTERLIALDLVCTHSEYLTEYRVDSITPTDWQETVRQDLAGTIGRDQLPDAYKQRAYIAYNSYKGPLACRGAPNKHLLLDIIQSDSTDEDVQSQEEIIRRRLEPLSWRISIGSRMYSRKSQGARYANRCRLEGYESGLLATGDGFQKIDQVTFEDASQDTYKLIDMPLVANEDVTDQNRYDLILYDETTVFFHVGIQESKLEGQRSVATLCKKSPWGGIVIPFVMNWESDKGEDKLAFRHMVFAKGMSGEGTVSRHRACDMVMYGVDRTPLQPIRSKTISPAQDIFYL